MIKVEIDSIIDVEKVYWQILNPLTKKKKYKKYSLVKKIEEFRISNVSTPLGNFISEFEKDDYKLLYETLTCRVKDYKNLILKIESLRIKHKVSPLFIKNGNGFDMTTTGKKVYEAFCYEETIECIKNAKTFIFKNIKMTTCPYCNTDKINIVNTAKNYNEFDFDHYYPKAKYPFLSMSLFNLIPTCEHCNRKYKRDKDFSIETHTHPYLDDFDDLCIFYPDFGDDLSIITNDIYQLLPIYIENCQMAKEIFDKDIAEKIKLSIAGRYTQQLDTRVSKFATDLELIGRYKNERFRVIEPIYRYYKSDISENALQSYNNIFSKWEKPDYDDLESVFKEYNTPLNRGRIATDIFSKLDNDLCKFFIDLKSSKGKPNN